MPVSPSPSETLSIAELRAAFEGRVIAPGDDGYNEARAVFSGAIDRHPALIVRAADAIDVARVSALARETGELAVRSGGHSPAGHGVSDGGIVLDLSALRALYVDVERRTAWAETGLTAGEYTAAVGAHGLATGFGDSGSVGLGGITLSGGIGYLVRRHGLTIDGLLAAEVVTADGELLPADAETHPDLFWAIRGGGGNFGVATRLKYRLHEVDTIVGGTLVLPRHARGDRLVRRGGRGRPGGALDDRERHAGAPAAVPGRRAPRPACGDGDPRARRRPGCRRARRRTLTAARGAARRHRAADAVPGDLPARAGGHPARRRRPHDLRGRRRSRDGEDDRRPPRVRQRADGHGPAARARRRDGAGAGRRHRLRASDTAPDGERRGALPEPR